MSNLAIAYKHNSIKQLYESSITRLVNARRIEEAQTFFYLLHSTSYKDDETKFVVLANAYNIPNQTRLGWEQWGFKYEEISYNFLSSFLTLENCYMSVNNFIAPMRQNDKCFQMTSFFVDLDYYKIPKYKNKSSEQMIEIMRKKGLFKNLEPSFFVDSGNGMYIYYLLEDTLNGQLNNLRYVWKRTEETLIKRFEEFGADSQASDIARVTRVPGSINGKTGKMARIIYNTNKKYNYNPFEEIKRYKLNEVTDLLLEKNTKKVKTERATYRGAVVLNWSMNVAYKRCRDLEKLVNLRGNCEGTRDFICLLYRHSLLHQNFSEEESLNETIKLALRMKDFGHKGFDEKYIETVTKPVVGYYKNFVQAQRDYEKTDKEVTFTRFVKDKKCMLWTNAKMIQNLEITQTEMEHMLTLFNTEEKNRRRRQDYSSKNRHEEYKKKLETEGKMLKSDSKKIIIKKIKDLLEEGLTSKQIMSILDLKKSTFYDYKKLLDTV